MSPSTLQKYLDSSQSSEGSALSHLELVREILKRGKHLNLSETYHQMWVTQLCKALPLQTHELELLAREQPELNLASHDPDADNLLQIAQRADQMDALDEMITVSLRHLERHPRDHLARLTLGRLLLLSLIHI